MKKKSVSRDIGSNKTNTKKLFIQSRAYKEIQPYGCCLTDVPKITMKNNAADKKSTMNALSAEKLSREKLGNLLSIYLFSTKKQTKSLEVHFQ